MPNMWLTKKHLGDGSRLHPNIKVSLWKQGLQAYCQASRMGLTLVFSTGGTGISEGNGWDRSTDEVRRPGEPSPGLLGAGGINGFAKEAIIIWARQLA